MSDEAIAPRACATQVVMDCLRAPRGLVVSGRWCHELAPVTMPAMLKCTITRNGVTYSADYEAFGETLLVFLPDDSSRENPLLGRDPEEAALEHLMFYVHTLEDEAKR